MNVKYQVKRRQPTTDRVPDKSKGHRISVMLVDDDPGSTQAAMALLQTHYGSKVDIVATASYGEECLTLAQILAPQVLLMDLARPCMDGLGTIPLLHILFPRIRVIALTSEDEEKCRRLVSAAGGHALVSKAALKTDLIPAVEWAIKNDIARSSAPSAAGRAAVQSPSIERN
jgi:DNA-binding NarL/FixJ family response regulator